jgi:cell division septal protein FtsQ
MKKRLKQHIKSINYRNQNYKNPYYLNKKKNSFKIPTWFKLSFALGFCGIIFLVWFLFFSNYFNTETIQVTGLKRTDKNEVLKFIQNDLNKKQLGFIPLNNLIIINKDNLKEKIEQRYKFDKIEINKYYPKTLQLNLVEKSYAAILYDNGKYYYLDNQGQIISELNELATSTEYVVIEDLRTEKKEFGYLNKFISLASKIKDQLDYLALETKMFKITNQTETINVLIKDGPELLFNEAEDTATQVNKLKVLINEKLKNEFFDKQYIDLRYGDKVYYQ